jgi:hypothetical protein
MRFQFARRQVVDSRRAPVAFHRFQRPPAVVLRHDGFPQMFVHRFLSEVSQNLRLGFAAWDSPRLHRFCPSRSLRVATAVVAPSDFRTLSTLTSVASLAPLLRSSALRSSGVTRLLRYYGLC